MVPVGRVIISIRWGKGRHHTLRFTPLRFVKLPTVDCRGLVACFASAYSAPSAVMTSVNAKKCERKIGLSNGALVTPSPILLMQLKIQAGLPS